MAKKINGVKRRCVTGERTSLEVSGTDYQQHRLLSAKGTYHLTSQSCQSLAPTLPEYLQNTERRGGWEEGPLGIAKDYAAAKEQRVYLQHEKSHHVSLSGETENQTKMENDT